MKYYIATSLSRAPAHRIVKDALTICGYEISYDWTLHGSVKSVSKERLREVAILELEGIAKADFVVVLLPGGGGTHLELGFAIAKGKKVFLHCEDSLVFELGPQTNAFYHHPDVTRLCCPLSEVGATVSSLLTQPAALL
ncbi:MAG TPA: nucleoside 2-deoxyribosyltransferase [Rhabdochlamydiaceae bacterium]|nr:nucleoside 2-deoxyribosyltransferase [Rhabdochlamydiaceae bacterium]